MSRPAPIRFAVFPVAGRGTRFLPATKASPKEMLPIVDKPLIQYAAEEALAAGARLLVFITGSSKRAIEDHFDTDPELESALAEQGKKDLRRPAARHPARRRHLHLHPPARTARPRPCGAVRARGGRQRAVLRAPGRRPDRCRRAGAGADARTATCSPAAACIGVQQVPRSQTGSYGIVATEDADGEYSRIRRMVEKPKPADAPSDLAVVGRYLLSGSIFERLKKVGRGAGGEIQLTDGIARTARRRAGLRVPVQGQALRLRQQARLSRGDGGVRPAPPRTRRAVRAVSRRTGRGPQAARLRALQYRL